MIMSDDPKRAYIEGFKDGWTEAMKYKQGAWPTVPTTIYEGCLLCGRTGLDNYVCYMPNCPSKISGAGAIGGSFKIGIDGVSANGPTGEWK